jgi:hypothetical protein
VIPFGEWLPDLADQGNPGSTEAKNVAPSIDGYRQLPSVNVATNAVNLYARGAIAAQANDANVYNYCGTGSKLYELLGQTWTDRSDGAGTYSVGADDFWEFAKWGEQILAVCGPGDVPQAITMGGVAFADLSGTPPQARHISIVRDFVVMGNNKEGGTQYPNRVRWSGINDETNWVTSKKLQSDYQDLFGEGGWVQKVVGGEYGVIVREHAIHRMDYIGPPLVFKFDQTLTGVGTPSPNSVVKFGDDVYFLSQTGFEVVRQGTVRKDIGANRINNWFFSELDASQALRVVGSLDRINRRIFWIFPGTGHASGLPNNGLIYDIDSDRWARFEDELEWIYDALGEGTTLDNLDAISGSIDALGESLDSRRWIGGAIAINAFDDAHKSGEFEGTAMAAVLETTEQQLTVNKRVHVSRVRPEIEGAGTLTIQSGTRESQDDAVAWGTTATIARDNGYPMRSESRYHRFRANVSGGFTRAQGINIVEASDAGEY